MPSLAHAALMPAATPPLARFVPPLPWDVHALGRLHGDGRIEWEPGVLPPEGPGRLVLWRPDARPQFASVRGRVSRAGRAWRLEAGGHDGGAREGWIVHLERDGGNDTDL